MIVLKCHCQLGVHGFDFDEKTENELLQLIEKNGQFRKVTVSGKSWRVPAAWLLLHDLEADKIDTYGFDTWPEETNPTHQPKTSNVFGDIEAR